MRLPRNDNVLEVYGMATGFGPLPSFVSPWMYNGTLTSYLERKPNLPYQKRLTIVSSTWTTHNEADSVLWMTDCASDIRT